MKRYALLFGLNYAHCASGELRGCINDVRLMTKFLQDELGFSVTAYTDDTARQDTSKAGILKHLKAAAARSVRDNLDVVWIHFSGHGSSMEDTTGDEDDGQDECLVPSDYETAGFIMDDDINRVFASFNPKTHVICVFDCCHSGTMADLKYGFDETGTASVENTNCKIGAKIITLSGCKDEQTSADAYGVAGQAQFTGAMTACLLEVLTDSKAREDIFVMMQLLHKELQARKFSQRPLVGATYDLRKEPGWLPASGLTTSSPSPSPPPPPPTPAFTPPTPSQPPAPPAPPASTKPIQPTDPDFDDLADPKWKDHTEYRRNCCFQ